MSVGGVGLPHRNEVFPSRFRDDDDGSVAMLVRLLVLVLVPAVPAVPVPVPVRLLVWRMCWCAYDVQAGIGAVVRTP